MKKFNQKFARHQDKIFAFKQQEGTVVDKVPPAFYKIERNPFIGTYLVQKSDDVVIPDEIYGSTLPRADLILNTFNRKEESTGVALFGTKGAGKTLLANVIAAKAIEQGLPVIDMSDITEYDSDILDFVNSLGECVVILDEFFKNIASNIRANSEDSGRSRSMDYDVRNAQDGMLTFFSGTNNAKRLTIIIDNSQAGLNEFFRDRPSRLRYIFNYDSVEKEVIEALCEKHKLDAEYTEALVLYAAKYSCTFDMINQLIDEIVHMEEKVSLKEITAYFNVPTLRTYTKATAKIIKAEMSGMYENGVIQNELININNDDGFTFRIKIDAPWKDAPQDLTQEQFEEDFDEYSYSSYLRDKKSITLEPHFGRNELVSIRGNISTYTHPMMGTITIEEEPQKEYEGFYAM